VLLDFVEIDLLEGQRRTVSLPLTALPTSWRWASGAFEQTWWQTVHAVVLAMPLRTIDRDQRDWSGRD
jgi:hypothetical protein